MDIDTFIALRTEEWHRLRSLSARRNLNADEADELIRLYRHAATDLALVQSRTPDPTVTAQLSALLAQARSAVTGSYHGVALQALARGVTVSFPVAVYRAWRWWVGMLVVNVALAAAMMIWLRDHPGRITRLLSSAQVRQLVDHDFASYYCAAPAQDFAFKIWTNNAVVAALALLLGVTIIGTLYVMASNTLNVGVVGGAMLGAGKADVFFGLILPHGMLELTAVFIAGGVGLQTGWAWIAPGVLPRGQSLARAARSAIVVALGLVGVLLVSGVIEAFVTPSGLPTAARIGIGAVAEVAFLSYVIVLGRRGAAEDIDVPAGLREDVLPVS